MVVMSRSSNNIWALLISVCDRHFPCALDVQSHTLVPLALCPVIGPLRITPMGTHNFPLQVGFNQWKSPARGRTEEVSQLGVFTLSVCCGLDVTFTKVHNPSQVPSSPEILPCLPITAISSPSLYTYPSQFFYYYLQKPCQQLKYPCIPLPLLQIVFLLNSWESIQCIPHLFLLRPRMKHYFFIQQTLQVKQCAGHLHGPESGQFYKLT